MASDCCELCRFSDDFKDGFVKCRRYPPRSQLIAIWDKQTGFPIEMQTGVWPNMPPSDWCGEFQPRAALKENEHGDE